MRELVPHIFYYVLITFFFFIALQCWLSLFLCLVHCLLHLVSWFLHYWSSPTMFVVRFFSIFRGFFLYFLVLFCFALLFLLWHGVRVFNFFGGQIIILICVVFSCFVFVCMYVFVHIYVSYLNHAISICISCLHCVYMMFVFASHPRHNYIMLTWHLFLHCACTTLMLLLSSSFLFASFCFFCVLLCYWNYLVVSLFLCLICASCCVLVLVLHVSKFFVWYVV